MTERYICPINILLRNPKNEANISSINESFSNIAASNIFDFVPYFYLASMPYLFNPLNNQFNIHVIRLSSNGQKHSTCVRSSSYYVLLRHSNR